MKLLCPRFYTVLLDKNIAISHNIKDGYSHTLQANSRLCIFHPTGHHSTPEQTFCRALQYSSLFGADY